MKGQHGSVIGQDGQRADGVVIDETPFQFQVEHSLWGEMRRDWFSATTKLRTG